MIINLRKFKNNFIRHSKYFSKVLQCQNMKINKVICENEPKRVVNFYISTRLRRVGDYSAWKNGNWVQSFRFFFHNYRLFNLSVWFWLKLPTIEGNNYSSYQFFIGTRNLRIRKMKFQVEIFLVFLQVWIFSLIINSNIQFLVSRWCWDHRLKLLNKWSKKRRFQIRIKRKPNNMGKWIFINLNLKTRFWSFWIL